MAYDVQILKDSVNPVGCRLTTFQLTYPRFVHAELMTHRLFSRNSASSRAIPIRTMIGRVLADPVVPSEWGTNAKGMQAGGLDGERSQDKDIELFERLAGDGHWSPLEHPAIALPTQRRIGNFRGWEQLRKMYPQEHVGGRMP